MDKDIFCTVKAISPECDPNNNKVLVNVGASKSLFAEISEFALRTKIGEFYGIVEPGLILAEHCWRDLKRGVYADGDMEASSRVFIFSRKPKFGFVWVGENAGGRIARVAAPDNKVFLVLVKKVIDGNNGNFGHIVQWNWVRESKNLPSAPVDYDTRYEQHCWSMNK